MLQDFLVTLTKLFIVILLAGVLFSCEQLPEADFYESSGIVSIDARSLGDQHNWQAERYYTSFPMVSYEDTLASSATLAFPFFVRRPGTYYVWTLSKQADSNPEENYLPFRVMDTHNFLIDNFRLELNQSDALEWLNQDIRSGEPIAVEFEQPGHYSVVFESQGRGGYVIDKLHLTLENARRPSGMGFPQTDEPGGDPVLAKRDQRVVIPPAWAFGVMIGSHAGQQETIERIEQMLEADFPVDAWWIAPENGVDGDHGLTDTIGLYREDNAYPDLPALWQFMNEKAIRPGLLLGGGVQNEGFFDEESAVQFRNYVDPLFDDGLAFLKLDVPADILLSGTAFQASLESSSRQESRGFILAGPENLYNPEFKEYPASWTGRAKTAWSQPDYPDFERNMTGGLKEQIEMAANPRLSTYEAPFLSNNLGGYDFFDAESPISEELYVRWVQFASFNTMMHIFTSPENETSNLPYNFSEEAQDQFRTYTHLRNRLFPYIYSLAHLVRPTGVKPVRGDGEHTTQFRLGNSLLAAPVYEEGAREREVYLPEGTWYDYWNGARYEGDQTIMADAPLERIPVFVQAGAIIPYREYSQNIMSGSNDRLTIEIYGGAMGTFRLYEDDGVTTRYQMGEFTTTAFRYFEGDGYSTFTIGRMVREYEGQSPEKEVTLQFKYVDEPVLITAEDEELERGEGQGQWLYDEETRTLQIRWVQPNIQKTDFYIQM